MSTQKLTSAIVQYLQWAPKSLVIRETCRIMAMDQYLGRLARPGMKILDIGCGDGRWWKILDEKKSFEVHGVDINEDEVAKARDHITAYTADITNPQDIQDISGDFDFAIGNCSLEHIPRINEALKNINNKMKDGASFMLFVPTPNWALRGKSVELLGSISPRLSMAFSGLINGFFQHWHLYHYDIWNHLLRSNGFEVVEVKGLGSRKLEFLFRLYLPTAFLSFIVKSVTGKYFNYFWAKICPRALHQRQAEELTSLITQSLTSQDDEDAFEYLIISRKKE